MVTSPVNAPRLARLMATAALPVVRSATSAAKSDTLLAAVRRAVATAAALEADSVVGNRPAILAVVSATWLVTAPKAKSATTVSRAASTVGHWNISHIIYQ